ncbi:MAG: hypothetical protein AAB337_02300 [Patescibacteria group bacterium]
MKTLLSVIGGITLLAAAIFGIYMGVMAIWNDGYDDHRREVASQLSDADETSKEAAKVKEAADKATAEATTAKVEADRIITQLNAEHMAFVQTVLAIRELKDKPNAFALTHDYDNTCMVRREWLSKNAAFNDSSVTVGEYGTFDFVRDGSGKVIDLKPQPTTTKQAQVVQK